MYAATSSSEGPAGPSVAATADHDATPASWSAAPTPPNILCSPLTPPDDQDHSLIEATSQHGQRSVSYATYYTNTYIHTNMYHPNYSNITVLKLIHRVESLSVLYVILIILLSMLHNPPTDGDVIKSSYITHTKAGTTPTVLRDYILIGKYTL